MFGLLVAVAHLGVVAIPCATGEVVARVAAAVDHQRDHSRHHGASTQHAHSGDVVAEQAPARLALSAPCLCGCDKPGPVATPTSSPRIGFALFPAKPAEFPAAEPTHHSGSVDVMPELIPHPLEHIPIPA